MSKTNEMELPKLARFELRHLIGRLLEENVDSCFDSDGHYRVPGWLVTKAWRMLAREVPTPPNTYNHFFSDAINGDDGFEAAVVAFAETGRITDAQALMSITLDLFEKDARAYLEDFEVDLRAYWAQPTDRS